MQVEHVHTFTRAHIHFFSGVHVHFFISSWTMDAHTFTWACVYFDLSMSTLSLAIEQSLYMLISNLNILNWMHAHAQRCWKHTHACKLKCVSVYTYSTARLYTKLLHSFAFTIKVCVVHVAHQSNKNVHVQNVSESYAELSVNVFSIESRQASHSYNR